VTPPAASAAAAPAIHPRPTVGRPKIGPARPPANPRRRSGGVRPFDPVNPRNPTRGHVRRWTGRTAPVHAVGLAETVATHRLLDRLIRGRLWIGVIAFALIGIVTMQLGLLKLNAGIGRSLEREALLQRENATLSAENSEIAAGESVESQAERMGMELIPSGALRFLAVHPSVDIGKAAAALSAAASTASGSTTTASSATTASSPTDGSAVTESSSGTETGAATSSIASPEPSETSATSTGTPAAGGTSETESATTSAPVDPSATSQEVSGASVSGTPTDTHPTETASSSGGDSAGGAGVPASNSAPTGGATTPEG
jgi:hypothetical protein